MTVVKYFHEEPAGLEVLAADTAAEAREAAEPLTLEAFLARPSVNRGYLAATVLPGIKTGATAPGAADAWVEPVIGALAKAGWWADSGSGSWTAADPAAALRTSAPGRILVTANGMPSIAAPDRPEAGARRRLAGILALMDSGCTVFLAEPAPDGADWAVYSREPLADRLRGALAERTDRSARCFVIPLREARGEHRFYFERYDLSLYARYEVG